MPACGLVLRSTDVLGAGSHVVCLPVGVDYLRTVDLRWGIFRVEPGHGLLLYARFLRFAALRSNTARCKDIAHPLWHATPSLLRCSLCVHRRDAASPSPLSSRLTTLILVDVPCTATRAAVTLKKTAWIYRNGSSRRRDRSKWRAGSGARTSQRRRRHLTLRFRRNRRRYLFRSASGRLVRSLFLGDASSWTCRRCCVVLYIENKTCFRRRRTARARLAALGATPLIISITAPRRWLCAPPLPSLLASRALARARTGGGGGRPVAR